MKKLSELLENTTVGTLYGDGSAAIAGLTYDSRAVKPGDCFFAVPGTQSDGYDYIPSAVAKGAAAVVCERMSWSKTRRGRWPTWRRRSTAIRAAN